MFGFCRDPLVDRLHELGFGLVGLADASIAPLDVLGRTGKTLNRLGSVDKIFGGEGLTIPSVDRDIDVRGLDIVTKTSLDSSLVANLVFGKWLGSDKVGLSGRMNQSNEVELSFGDLKRDRIDFAPLDEFLNAARLVSDMPLVTRLLEQDDVYVITSTLKAKSMLLQAQSGRLIEGDAQVPEIQGVAGGEIKVKLDAKDSKKMVFESSTPVVFAFQAVQLRYDHGAYKTLQVARDTLILRSDKGLATAESAAETGYLSDRVGPGFARFGD